MKRLRKVVAFGANVDLGGYRTDTGDEGAIISAFGVHNDPDYARLSPAPELHNAMVVALRQMWETEPTYTAEELRTIATPFLIMAGADEEIIAEPHARYLADTIPSRNWPSSRTADTSVTRRSQTPSTRGCWRSWQGDPSPIRRAPCG